MNLPLPCIVCGMRPEHAVPPEVQHTPCNQPYAATAFTSTGHYGSTVWDPMNGQQIEINVCDSCLVKAGEREQVLVHDLVPAGPDMPPEFHYWRGVVDDEP